MSRQLDTVGWYIATLHQLVGHVKAAAVLGQPPYNPDMCVLCLFERGEVSRRDVIERLGVEIDATPKQDGHNSGTAV